MKIEYLVKNKHNSKINITRLNVPEPRVFMRTQGSGTFEAAFSLYFVTEQ